MFRVGKKHFLSIEDYEDRYWEVNPKDLLRPEIKKLLLSIPKDESSMYTKIGNEYFDKGEYNSGVENYNKALEYNERNFIALFYRGLCFIGLMQFESSIKDLTKVLMLKPSFYQAYFYRANARVGILTYYQIKKAIDDYTSVINKPRPGGNPFFLRGYCYLLLKKEQLAIADWRIAKKYRITKESEENWKKDYLE